MDRHLPPVLGTLERVIPAVQVQQREPWTLALISVERWSTCAVASFDLHRSGPIDRSVWLHPWLEVDAVDERGASYATWFGGGYGGGLRDGGEQHRSVKKLTPPFDPAAGELRLIARLQLRRQEDGFPPVQTVVWEDPAPWIFAVPLTVPSRMGEPEARPRGETPSASPAPRSTPPELRRLLQVVPVVETREAGGWAITLIAVERYDDGFGLVYRLLGAEKAPMNPELAVRVRDDRGNVYAVWGGGGNGEPTTQSCHWRMSSTCTPALDPESRELLIEIPQVQAMTLQPEEGRPNIGRMVVSGADAVDWRFAVSLR